MSRFIFFKQFAGGFDIPEGDSSVWVSIATDTIGGRDSTLDLHLWNWQRSKSRLVSCRIVNPQARCR